MGRGGGSKARSVGWSGDWIGSKVHGFEWSSDDAESRMRRVGSHARRDWRARAAETVDALGQKCADREIACHSP